MKKIFPYENQYRRRGFDLIVGIDEAGRGPLAGPVAAGAVAVIDLKVRGGDMEYLIGAVKDSKKLSESKREEIFEIITASGNIAWGSALVSERIIDKVNILEASKMAMSKAFLNMKERHPALIAGKLIYCLIDGNFPVNIPEDQTSVVAGDAKVFSISAASIIAKVSRDRYMAKLDKKYPQYGFSRHKGYPTKQHFAALRNFGASPAHRMSFAPCADINKKAII